MAEPQEFRLELPAVAESIALARLFVATILRSRSVVEDTVSDAKLAVSELLSVAILDHNSLDVSVIAAVTSTSITVRIDPFPSAPGRRDQERIDIAAAVFPGQGEMAELGSFSIDVAMA